MTDAVEKVARAIYEGRNGHGCKPWGHLPQSHRDPYRRDAEAALAAMGEGEEVSVKQAEEAVAKYERIQMHALSLGESAKDAKVAAMQVVLEASPRPEAVVEAVPIAKGLRDIAERKADDLNRHPGRITKPEDLVEWKAADLIERLAGGT